MSIKTKCKTCLFADYADSENPCAMDIINHVKDKKSLDIVDDFYEISPYRCAFAFSINVYKNNINTIGSIDNLKNELTQRAKIDYYMVVFLDPTHIDQVCESISQLNILPKFISIIVNDNNETASLINKLNVQLPKNVMWKLHNILGELSLQESLDTVFKTNTHVSGITYLWINKSNSYSSWNSDVKNINDIIVLEQPYINACFRKDNDGLFLTFNNYNNILESYGKDILTSIDTIENKMIAYYA